MAIRDQLRANAAHLLGPDETIETVFPAQTVSQWFSLVSYWIIILANAYRVVVVTNRRIIVCNSGRFRMTPVKDVIRELPRQLSIGPANGLWYRTEVLGERLYIAKRFHKDIAAADTHSHVWMTPAT